MNDTDLTLFGIKGIKGCNFLPKEVLQTLDVGPIFS